MKKLYWSFLLLLTLPCSLLAQRVVEVSYSIDRQGNYVFSCMNKAFCNYVLNVEFTTLENGRSDHALPFEGEVKPGSNKLFIITPDKGKDLQLKYKSSYRKGCLHPYVKSDFTYLLPITPGKTAQAYHIVLTTGTPDTGYAIRLKMKQGDTIYAARRGTVTAVDISNTENDAGASTTSNWNYVEIVQADCSFAQYGVLKKDGAFVKPGQVVEAGTPIGLVGGDQYGRGSDIRFSVTYYNDQQNTVLPLSFWTKGNGKGTLRHGATYTSEFPKNLLTQEQPKAPASHKTKH